jgi:hypothetical protein
VIANAPPYVINIKFKFSKAKLLQQSCNYNIYLQENRNKQKIFEIAVPKNLTKD